MIKSKESLKRDINIGGFLLSFLGVFYFITLSLIYYDNNANTALQMNNLGYRFSALLFISIILLIFGIIIMKTKSRILCGISFAYMLLSLLFGSINIISILVVLIMLNSTISAFKLKTLEDILENEAEKEKLENIKKIRINKKDK